MQFSIFSFTQICKIFDLVHFLENFERLRFKPYTRSNIKIKFEELDTFAVAWLSTSSQMGLFFLDIIYRMPSVSFLTLSTWGSTKISGLKFWFYFVFSPGWKMIIKKLNEKYIFCILRIFWSSRNDKEAYDHEGLTESRIFVINVPTKPPKRFYNYQNARFSQTQEKWALPQTKWFFIWEFRKII